MTPDEKQYLIDALRYLGEAVDRLVQQNPLVTEKAGVTQSLGRVREAIQRFASAPGEP